MVMETPSPQCVGREFVRQYYTLLNEAPKHLYRFYSNNSSFVHGGVDKPGEEQPPVVGQAEILKKIQSLNFKDCHTKIRQVDSQATVESAVVVQVTGELSNNGSPMRRFMQTFVLAPQSPKKYYVHNDIFRYQDEVFQESDESEEDVDQQVELQQPVATDEPEQYSDAPADNYADSQTAHELNFHSQTKPALEPVKPVTPPPEPTSAPPAPQTTLTNGQHQPEPEDSQKEQPATTDSVPAVLPAETNETSETTEQSGDNNENKTFSWANVVNKSSGGQTPSPAVAVVQPYTSKPGSEAPAQPINEETNQPRPQKPSRGERGGLPQRNSDQKPPRSEQIRPDQGRSDQARISGEEDEKRQQRYPDTHQVFVGNLQPTVQDNDLREFFSCYGQVVDVRINRNQQNKVPFGFVVFQDDKPVKTILHQTQKFEMNGHRLNVEEKKAKGKMTNNPRPRPQNRPGGRGPPRENSGSRADNRVNNMNKNSFQSRR